MTDPTVAAHCYRHHQQQQQRQRTTTTQKKQGQDYWPTERASGKLVLLRTDGRAQYLLRHGSANEHNSNGKAAIRLRPSNQRELFVDGEGQNGRGHPRRPRPDRLRVCPHFYQRLLDNSALLDRPEATQFVAAPADSRRVQGRPRPDAAKAASEARQPLRQKQHQRLTAAEWQEIRREHGKRMAALSAQESNYQRRSSALQRTEERVSTGQLTAANISSAVGTVQRVEIAPGKFRRPPSKRERADERLYRLERWTRSPDETSCSDSSKARAPVSPGKANRARAMSNMSKILAAVNASSTDSQRQQQQASSARLEEKRAQLQTVDSGIWCEVRGDHDTPTSSQALRQPENEDRSTAVCSKPVEGGLDLPCDAEKTTSTSENVEQRAAADSLASDNILCNAQGETSTLSPNRQPCGKPEQVNNTPRTPRHKTRPSELDEFPSMSINDSRKERRNTPEHKRRNTRLHSVNDFTSEYSASNGYTRTLDATLLSSSPVDTTTGYDDYTLAYSQTLDCSFTDLTPTGFQQPGDFHLNGNVPTPGPSILKHHISDASQAAKGSSEEMAWAYMCSCCDSSGLPVSCKVHPAANGLLYVGSTSSHLPVIYECVCAQCKASTGGQAPRYFQVADGKTPPSQNGVARQPSRLIRGGRRSQRSRGHRGDTKSLMSNQSHGSRIFYAFTECFRCFDSDSESLSSAGSDSDNDDGDDGGDESDGFEEHGDGVSCDDDSDGGDSGSESGGEVSLNSAELYDDQNNMFDIKNAMGEGEESDGAPGSDGSDSDSLTELRSRSKKGSGTSDEDGEDDDEMEEDDEFDDSWDSVCIYERE